MSWTHVAWASKQTAGSGTNKLVLLMIADATSHDNPILVIKMERMIRLCELSERTIRNAIRDLEDRGLVGTVERFFEGQQIANGYFLIGDEWERQARDATCQGGSKDGLVSRIKVRPAPDAALGGHQMPGGGAPDAGQIQPSSFLPSYETTEGVASLPVVKQQSERVGSDIGPHHISEGLQQTVDAMQASPVEQPPPPAPSPSRRASRGMVPPTIEECSTWACAEHPSVPRIRDVAEAWWRRFNSQEWEDSQGNKVKSWKGKFNTWIQQGWYRNLDLPAVHKQHIRPEEML